MFNCQISSVKFDEIMPRSFMFLYSGELMLLLFLLSFQRPRPGVSSRLPLLTPFSHRIPETSALTRCTIPLAADNKSGRIPTAIRHSTATPLRFHVRFNYVNILQVQSLVMSLFHRGSSQWTNSWERLYLCLMTVWEKIIGGRIAVTSRLNGAVCGRNGITVLSGRYYRPALFRRLVIFVGRATHTHSLSTLPWPGRRAYMSRNQCAMPLNVLPDRQLGMLPPSLSATQLCGSTITALFRALLGSSLERQTSPVTPPNRRSPVPPHPASDPRHRAEGMWRGVARTAPGEYWKMGRGVTGSGLSGLTGQETSTPAHDSHRIINLSLAFATATTVTSWGHPPVLPNVDQVRTSSTSGTRLAHGENDGSIGLSGHIALRFLSAEGTRGPGKASGRERTWTEREAAGDVGGGRGIPGGEVGFRQT